MREYEIMLILPADADEKAIGGVSERITQVLAQSAGEITGTDRWGRRRFAFPIRKQTEGYYLVLTFTAEPEGLKELDRVLSLADEVVRFKVVALPDRAKKPAAKAGTEAAPAEEAIAPPIVVETEESPAVEDPAAEPSEGGERAEADVSETSGVA